MMIDKENENAPKPNQVYSYYKSAANVGVTNHKHSISKGTTTTKSNVMAKDRVSYATCSNNSSLTHPPSMLKIDSSKRNSVASLSSSSSSSYSKQNFIRHQKKTISKSSAKNHHHHHHLPTIQNNNNLRRYSNPRHTLDLSTITNNDLGALDKSSVVQRANTICNSSMLFTSGQVQHLEEQQQMPSSVTSTTTVSSSASSMQNNEQHSVISNESQGSDSEGINPLNYDTVDTKDLLDNLELEQECIDEQKCNLLQKRLWEEDAELCLKEQIAEFLGLK
ncbi:MAG: hypothetical protein EXX96DRAFT_152443 [Benjaminiella poitrasii]|nr:MAG: hypothetical protein EXX96DRAFT_152443 [Benjaminiella poitrasii]